MFPTRSISTRSVRPTSSYSVSFIGSSTQKIDFGNNINLGTDDFTISVWYKRTDSDEDVGLLQKRQSSDDVWWLNVQDDDKVEFRVNLGRSNELHYKTSSIGGLNDTEWHHIVVNVDRDDTGASQLYIDGKELATIYDEQVESGIAKNFNNTGKFLIGVGSMAGDIWMNGQISDVSIFNIALSSNVGKLRDGTHGAGNAKPADLTGLSGLVAWWRMGDGVTYPNIEDYVGSVDGVMTNMTPANIVEDSP
jgi:hypothetical protein